MSVIQPPTERTCERCGRAEHWDDDQQTFVAASDENLGRPHCLHEWDINGQYNPLRKSPS
jgi:hypothetical protein